MKQWPTSIGLRALILLILSTFLISLGTIGYIVIEDYTPLEALYMTIITLTTVGFGEVKKLDDPGRIFTIVLLLLGVGFITFTAAFFSQILLDDNLLELYRRRKVKKRLDQLSNHIIVCGYGQTGQMLVNELVKEDIPLMVIEKDESHIIRLREKGIPYLLEDATEESSLLDAGIQRAKGLVSAVCKDTDNVFIVLTARDINKDIFIVSRSGTPGTEKRLIKAGADRVVSPFSIGAMKIAQNIIRPTVTDFLDLALSGEGMELSLEELVIPVGAVFAGKMLKDSGLRRDYNLIVVAIKRTGGRMVYNPSSTKILNAGDTLVVIGHNQDLLRLGKNLCGNDGSLKACRLPT